MNIFTPENKAQFMEIWGCINIVIGFVSRMTKLFAKREVIFTGRYSVILRIVICLEQDVEVAAYMP